MATEVRRIAANVAKLPELCGSENSGFCAVLRAKTAKPPAKEVKPTALTFVAPAGAWPGLSKMKPRARRTNKSK